MRPILLSLVLAAAAAAQTASYPSAVATDNQLRVAANNVSTTVSFPMLSSDTSANVVNATGIVTNSVVTIDNENIAVCNVVGNVLSFGKSSCPNVDGRGFDGTSAASHNAGATVALNIDAWHHNAVAAEVKAVETALGANLANVVAPPGGGTQTQQLQIKPNAGNNTTYQWASKPQPIASDYNFPAQTPGGSLTGGGGAQTITVVPCPLGINNGAGTWVPVYLSAGSGSPEVQTPSGGTCISGAASGTIIVSPTNSHSGAWTVSSATAGVMEAICAMPSAGGLATVAANVTLLANVGACGKTNVEVEKLAGVTVSGAFTVIGGSFGNVVGYMRMRTNGGAIFDVKMYGAKGDAVFGGVGTDDTAAVQAAINAARTAVGSNLPGGGIIHVPRGGYMISNLDMTQIAPNYGIVFEGEGAGATIIYAKAGTSNYGTSTGHLFDLTGSGGITFQNFQVGGDAIGPIPTTAFFMAPSATLATSVIEFQNVTITGRYSAATMYVYGLASADWRKLAAFNYKTGATYVMYLTSSNALSLASQFTTVYATPGVYGASNLSWVDCEFHHMGDTNGFAVRSDGASNLLMTGGNISSNNSQQAYWFLDSGTSNVGWHGVSFYSDFGPAPTNAFNVVSPTAVRGFDVQGSVFQTASGFVGGTGVVLGGNAGRPGPRGHTTIGSPVAAASTVYMSTAGHDATRANVESPLGARAILSDAYCQSSAAPGTGKTYTITLLQGAGTATAVTMQIANSATTASDTTHYATVGASSLGEAWSWQIVTSAGAASAQFACTVSMIQY